MIKQLWKPRYNTFQVYLKYFPIQLQSIHFFGYFEENLSFFEKKSRKGDQGQIFMKDILLDENGSGLT